MTAAFQPPPFEGEWARCRPWLEAALEYDGGFHGLADVRAAVEAGEAHFWPGVRSAVVTQFWDFPRLKAIHYWLAGGELDEIVEQMQPTINAWGRAHGCEKSIICGRLGWKKPLAACGYEPLWLGMARSLS